MKKSPKTLTHALAVNIIEKGLTLDNFNLEALHAGEYKKCHTEGVYTTCCVPPIQKHLCVLLSVGGNHWLTSWKEYRQEIAESKGIEVGEVNMPVGLDKQMCRIYINLNPTMAKHVASTHNEVIMIEVSILFCVACSFVLLPF